MKVLVASKNASKIDGTKVAFEKFFDDVNVVGVSVESEVSEQPFDKETLIGAKNRIKNLKKYCKTNNLQADYFVAIESGIINIYDEYFLIDFVVIENNLGQEGIGTSCAFPIPKRLIKDIKERGFGQVFDEIFVAEKTRKVGGGIMGLTHGNITRTCKTTESVIMALTRFVNNEFWQ